MPKFIDGFKCYAPELAFESPDFPKNSFYELYQKEDANFWFRSRNRIIRFLIKKYLLSPAGDQMSLLEVGCGTGYVLKGLSELKNLRLVGADVHLEGLKYARMRLPDVELIQLDVSRMPFESEFDAVGLFDVLEHIENDEQVLKGVHHVLKPRGTLFVTVPQHQFLWSRVDEMAGHKRRYSGIALETLLKNQGFEIIHRCSFVSLLFPLMVVSRCLQKVFTSKSHPGSFNEFNIPSSLNAFLEKIMTVEEWLIRKGVSVPFGGSLVVVSRKI